MPIYEYQCSACGHQFETIARDSSDLAKSCPKCGKAKLQKLLSSFAVSAGSGGPDLCDSSACPGCPSQNSCPCAMDDDY